MKLWITWLGVEKLSTGRVEKVDVGADGEVEKGGDAGLEGDDGGPGADREVAGIVDEKVVVKLGEETPAVVEIIDGSLPEAPAHARFAVEDVFRDDGAAAHGALPAGKEVGDGEDDGENRREEAREDPAVVDARGDHRVRIGDEDGAEKARVEEVRHRVGESDVEDRKRGESSGDGERDDEAGDDEGAHENLSIGGNMRPVYNTRTAGGGLWR